MVTDPNLTRMLNDAARGAPGAADRLLPVIYDELRRMASRQVSGDAATVEPTALVHEAWLRIAGDDEVAWNHRGHFFGSAAQAMRRILVEHARARSAHKRGGGARPEALEELPFVVPDADQVLDLEAALAKLEAERPREARIVVMRYYGGLSVAEIANAIGVSIGTVERDWRLARARLSRQLGAMGH